MEKLFTAAKFIQYKLTSGNPHDVHSPFVFELLNNVILDTTPYYCYEPIESVRSKMLLDNRTIQLQDFGTGNHQLNQTKKICDIAKSSLQQKKYAQLLFRLINYLRATTILELGTSLGITTLYLAMTAKKNTVITLEGSDQIAVIAQENFDRLKVENIELLKGTFDQTLPLVLKKNKSVDFIYFDGNHKKDATLAYFNFCLQHKSENSVFVFDDIHWSKEMNRAWKEICLHSEVSISIDLFKIGIVFFKRGIPKQHYQLNY